MIGFGSALVTRQPIYGEQIAGKVGYIEKRDGHTWICAPDGHRVARILRYKPHQAPQPSANACGGTIIHADF